MVITHLPIQHDYSASPSEMDLRNIVRADDEQKEREGNGKKSNFLEFQPEIPVSPLLMTKWR